MAVNAVITGGEKPKIKLVQALMVVLVTCTNEEDPLKNEGTRVVTPFLPWKVYGDFSRCSKSNLSEIQTHPSFMAVLLDESVRHIIKVEVSEKHHIT